MLNLIKTKIVYRIKHLQVIVFYRIGFSNKSHSLIFNVLYFQIYSMITCILSQSFNQ